jgi:hypothetical protein
VVVEHCIAGTPWHATGDQHYHLLVASFLELVDERDHLPDDRGLLGPEDMKWHAWPPAFPVLLELAFAFVGATVRVCWDHAHYFHAVADGQGH